MGCCVLLSLCLVVVRKGAAERIVAERLTRYIFFFILFCYPFCFVGVMRRLIFLTLHGRLSVVCHGIRGLHLVCWYVKLAGWTAGWAGQMGESRTVAYHTDIVVDVRIDRQAGGVKEMRKFRLRTKEQTHRTPFRGGGEEGSTGWNL
ncbi:hypothetical protein B0T17DRAFT_537301 [Bombardia bombarda]|uniref:Uncharacterized protein n=1 Tax=Bombardia bombarda TaxID=252184 RepID=A0AA40BYD4_9PEZI|nr:hypothetical protein B0T17DRAFT_537301 [Bombardia bombarda]